MKKEELMEVMEIKKNIAAPMISIEDLPRNEKGEFYSGTLLYGLKKIDGETKLFHVYARDGILNAVTGRFEIESHVKGKTIKMKDCIPDSAFSETVQFDFVKLLIEKGFDFSLSEMKDDSEALEFGEFMKGCETEE